MQKGNKIGIILFLFIASFSIFSEKVVAQRPVIAKIIIDTDTTWTKETPDLIFDKAIVIQNGASLTIEKGTKVVFQVNPDQPFNSAGFEVTNGRLVINGTREEQVVLTSPDDGFALVFTDNTQTSFMRYVTLENGGFIPISAGGSGDLVPHIPVIEIVGGKLHIENSKFINSRYNEMDISDVPAKDADGNYIDDGNGDWIKNKVQVEVVNSNFSYKDAVRSSLSCDWLWDENTQEEYIDPECYKRVYLKDDWYNHAFGPTLDSDEIQKGYGITGDYYLDLWKAKADIINPVLVIPGIMGSAEVSGVWQMDPILHTYDDLLASLEENGYTKNKNLFEFPYDWENGNATTADKLRDKITEIVATSKISKVDLVAHSMGGLVARSYIEGDNYGNNVDELMTLGAPHHGSPKSYLTWEAGEMGITADDYFAKHHFEMEALHNHYANIFEYIQEMVPSVKQLLPDYDYLFDVKQNSVRSYADNYPKNTFLDNLNDSSNLEKLKSVNFTNIVGVLDDAQSTISKIRVVDSTIENRWVNGMPENFYAGNTDQGMEYDKGDATVPKSSADGIVADNKLEAKAAHNELPTVSQCAVVSILLQKQNCVSVNKTHIPNILMFNIFSPIDIQVIAPDGKRVGKNFETSEIFNEIEGAYYSGYETENESLTIPNPLDGEYRILTQGTGDGDYRIEATKISSSENSPQNASESTGTIEGVAVSGQQEEKTIEVSGAEVIAGEGVEADSVAPEAKIQFNPSTRKLDIVGIDNLSQNVSVVVASQPVVKKSNRYEKDIRKWFADWQKRDKNHSMQNQVATLTDEAGNTSVVVFAKTRDVNNRIFATIKSIAYNGVETILNKTSLQYKWQLDRKKQFSQLATRIQTETASLESHYLPKKNQTWLMEKPRDLADDNGDDDSEKRPTQSKLSGMVVPALVTEKGVAKITY